MDHREVLTRLFRTALLAVDPLVSLRSHLSVIRDTLHLSDGTEIPLPARVIVLGMGKAAPCMARGIEELLGDRIVDGLVSCPYSSDIALRRLPLIRGEHPLPGLLSETAGREMLRLAHAADHDTLVIVLVSGGGSACVAVPAPGITLEDKRAVTELLLLSGAGIGEINAVRAHLSAIKGGNLLRTIDPASSLTLVLSDVIDGNLATVASGPTLPNPTTHRDALDILDRRRLTARTPKRVLALLERGASGLEPDTLRRLESPRHHHLLVGSNRMAVQAAVREARQLGWPTRTLSEPLRGDAAEVGRLLAEAIASEPGKRCCLIAGGETTVTVTGSGKGGRNQEMALGFLNGPESGATLLAASTDGIDGPTDAAGAFADAGVRNRACKLNLSPTDYLRNNNAYEFLTRTRGLFVTGPTGTNVCDLAMILRG